MKGIFSKSTLRNTSVQAIFGLVLGMFIAGYAAFWVFNKNDSFPAGVEAGTAQNASGYAWSENIGWISFNCTDGGTCGGVDYGVNVRSDNYLEGYAWSENIGWISFNLADTGAPPGQYDYSNQGFIAKLQNNGQLQGWARALGGMADPNDGWDGWIKLYKHPSDGGPDYGVTYNSTTKEFSGFAWGSDVVGWASFNCSDLGACGSSNYKVIANINAPPSASQLSVAQGDYCAVPSHTFSWTFSDPQDGSTQTSYNLQADNNTDFFSPEISLSGGSGTSYSVIVAVSPGVNQLAYNTSYYWRLKVFDSQGADSGWVSPVASQSPFSTKPHLYPDSNFTFVPASPSQGEEIRFTQNAVCYSITNSAISCPAIATNYSWDFDYETPPFTRDAIGQSATTTYSGAGTHTVALDVTDADNNTCRGTGTGTVSLKSPLPKFKETAPSS
jgi:hypothetical protein